jgi:hypothetical protein
MGKYLNFSFFAMGGTDQVIVRVLARNLGDYILILWQGHLSV